MLVVGVDLSITATGIARFAGGDGQVHLVGSPGLTDKRLPERLDALDALAHLVVAHVRGLEDGAPDLVVLEAMETSKAYGGIAERSWLWYDVARRLLAHGVPVAVAAPAQLKMYATGKGNAGKAEVIDAVARRLPMFETRGNDNLCDAAVLCAMGCATFGRPLATLPVTHRRALEKIAWPAAAVFAPHEEMDTDG